MTRWLAAARQAQSAGTQLTQPTKHSLGLHDEAGRTTKTGVLSVMSVLSEGVRPEAAPLMRPPEAPTQPAPPSPSRQERATPSTPGGGDVGRHGRSVTGAPRTWTGRLVKPEAWGTLSEWERHGPDGRLWCGCCRAWAARETALAHADAARAEWITAKGE